VLSTSLGVTHGNKNNPERAEKEKIQMQLLGEHKVNSERGFLALKAVTAHGRPHH